jgi:hypothetical protein
VLPDVRPVQARPAPGRTERPVPVPAEAADAGSSSAAAPPATLPLTGDLAATLADEVTQKAELIMLAQRKRADAGELAIDRMRTEFDIHEQERAEYLREWNAIRDASMEQMKHDDEILKKWIALI